MEYIFDLADANFVCIRIYFRILLKSQFKKHLILGGLINGKLHGPNDLVQLGEIEDLKTGDLFIIENFQNYYQNELLSFNYLN